MSYNLKMTETACQNLKEIAVCLLENESTKSTAKKVVTEIVNKCKDLEDFPSLGSFPKDRILLSNDYRYIKVKDYYVFYETNEAKSTVYILSIISTKNNKTKILNKMI